MVPLLLGVQDRMGVIEELPSSKQENVLSQISSTEQVSPSADQRAALWHHTAPCSLSVWAVAQATLGLTQQLFKPMTEALHFSQGTWHGSDDRLGGCRMCAEERSGLDRGGGGLHP